VVEDFDATNTTKKAWLTKQGRCRQSVMVEHFDAQSPRRRQVLNVVKLNH
jgi:hypothetical protein